MTSEHKLCDLILNLDIVVQLTSKLNIDLIVLRLIIVYHALLMLTINDYIILHYVILGFRHRHYNSGSLSSLRTSVDLLGSYLKINKYIKEENDLCS